MKPKNDPATVVEASWRHWYHLFSCPISQSSTDTKSGSLHLPNTRVGNVPLWGGIYGPQNSQVFFIQKVKDFDKAGGLVTRKDLKVLRQAGSTQYSSGSSAKGTVTKEQETGSRNHRSMSSQADESCPLGQRQWLNSHFGMALTKRWVGIVKKLIWDEVW